MTTASTENVTSGVVVDEDIKAKKGQVGKTLRCPYCDQELEKWIVPDSPFNEISCSALDAAALPFSTVNSSLSQNIPQFG